jgi:hypothetical protein
MLEAQVITQHWNNSAIKRELAAIGFFDYEKMAADAVNYSDRSHLQKNVDLNPTSGDRCDQVRFVVAIHKDAKGAFKEILSIHAFYDNFLNTVAGEDTGVHLRFTKRNGHFPTIEDMIFSVVDEQRNQLVRYSHAYKIASSLQAFRKGFRSFTKPRR